MLAKVVSHTRDIIINCGYRVFVVLRCSSSLWGMLHLNPFYSQITTGFLVILYTSLILILIYCTYKFVAEKLKVK